MRKTATLTIVLLLAFTALAKNAPKEYSAATLTRVASPRDGKTVYHVISATNVDYTIEALIWLDPLAKIKVGDGTKIRVDKHGDLLYVPDPGKHDRDADREAPYKVLAQELVAPPTAGAVSAPSTTSTAQVP